MRNPYDRLTPSAECNVLAAVLDEELETAEQMLTDFLPSEVRHLGAAADRLAEICRRVARERSRF